MAQKSPPCDGGLCVGLFSFLALCQLFHAGFDGKFLYSGVVFTGPTLSVPGGESADLAAFAAFLLEIFTVHHTPVNLP